MVSLIIICRCKISVFNENVLLRLHICIIVYRQRRGSTETHNFLLSSCLALLPPPKKKLSQRYIVKKTYSVNYLSAFFISFSWFSICVYLWQVQPAQCPCKLTGANARRHFLLYRPYCLLEWRKKLLEIIFFRIYSFFYIPVYPLQDGKQRLLHVHFTSIAMVS